MTWQAIWDPLTSGRLCVTLLHSMWQVALFAATRASERRPA
jgi:hypothetical protein